MNKTYSDFASSDMLNTSEMFALKAGSSCETYGCDFNVCNTNRAGAEKLCSTAYCRTGVGPEKPVAQKCDLFTSL